VGEVGLDYFGNHVDKLLDLLRMGVGKVLDAVELDGEIGKYGLAYLKVDLGSGEDSLIFDPSLDAEIVEDVGRKL
jgi:hypothetical protein